LLSTDKLPTTSTASSEGPDSNAKQAVIGGEGWSPAVEDQQPFITACFSNPVTVTGLKLSVSGVNQFEILFSDGDEKPFDAYVQDGSKILSVDALTDSSDADTEPIIVSIAPEARATCVRFRVASKKLDNQGEFMTVALNWEVMGCSKEEATTSEQSTVPTTAGPSTTTTAAHEWCGEGDMSNITDAVSNGIATISLNDSNSVRDITTEVIEGSVLSQSADKEVKLTYTLEPSDNQEPSVIQVMAHLSENIIGGNVEILKAGIVKKTRVFEGSNINEMFKDPVEGDSVVITIIRDDSSENDIVMNALEVKICLHPTSGTTTTPAATTTTTLGTTTLEPTTTTQFTTTTVTTTTVAECV